MSAARDEEAERMERLIASNEHVSNEIRQLVQLLKGKEARRASKADGVRRVPQRKVAVSERAAAIAKAALARHGRKG